jgi:hypothetical protein
MILLVVRISTLVLFDTLEVFVYLYLFPPLFLEFEKDSITEF